MAKLQYTTENGKITSLIIDGKKHAMRDIEKAQNTPYWQWCEAGPAQNPFSGDEVELNALEKTIYLWCLNWMARYENGGPVKAGAPIQVFDTMKYIILKTNPEAYMTLLD